MSKFGKSALKSLREGLADMRAGKPFKQTIVRRINVKGKTVFTRETFTGPIQSFKRRKR
jgi:hypothetical protein